MPAAWLTAPIVLWCGLFYDERARGEVIDSLDLRPAVMEVGLDFQVGIGGARLSALQRQRIGIARMLLKGSDILILNEAGAAFDASSQTRLVTRILELAQGKGILWALHRPDLADRFEHVIVVRGGRVVEQGSFEELNKEGSALREMLDGD